MSKTGSQYFARVLVATVLHEGFGDFVLVLAQDNIPCGQVEHLHWPFMPYGPRWIGNRRSEQAQRFLIVMSNRRLDREFTFDVKLTHGLLEPDAVSRRSPS